MTQRWNEVISGSLIHYWMALRYDNTTTNNWERQQLLTLNTAEAANWEADVLDDGLW